MSPANGFFQQFVKPPTEYRPVAFWFLNHRLENEELIRQVREMAAQGMGGFMCHARDGLRSGYLKEEWREALKTVIAEAERHGMQVWLYDENHYPSGPAGDNLPMRFPDRTMKSLAVLWEGVFDGGQAIEADVPQTALEYIAVAASLEKPHCLDLSSSVCGGRMQFVVPSDWGKTAVLILGVVPWRPMPGHTFPYYPDYTDPALTDEFIALTHRWYFEAFGRKFGATIRGIFSDNSCGNFGHIRRSIPWGRDFEERFHRSTGIRLRSILPALFCPQVPDARRVRLIFWRFFGRTYLDAYFKRITDYCNSVGLLSTGHLCLEDGMGEHVRQIGDYFEVMRHFTLTAVDQLGPERAGDRLAFGYGEDIAACLKNTSSAARLTGSPRVMCESFGLASGPWALDLFEMKRISGWMAALGVDLFVPHGLYYSIGGSRKWECTPDHLHNPLWKYYSSWTDWIGRLCYAGADGATLADVAILYPIHSLRADLEVAPAPNAPNLSGTPPPSGRGAATDYIEATYRCTINALIDENIDFEVIDEEALATGSVAHDGTLCLPAPRRRDLTLRVLILPAMTVIEKRSLKILGQFVEAGGMVLFLNAVPSHAFEPEEGALNAAEWGAEHLGSPLSLGNTKCRRFWEKAIGKGCLRFAGLPPVGDCEQSREFLARQLLDRIVRRITFKTSDGERPALVTRAWAKEGRRCYYAFNHSRKAIPGVRVKVDETAPLTRIDLATGLPTAWNGAEPYDFEPAEGLLLMTGVPPQSIAAASCRVHVLETMPMDGKWAFTTDRINILPLRRWATLVRDNIQLHHFIFESGMDLEAAVLLLDLERSNSELDGHAYGPRLECTLNGRSVKDFRPGTYLDRNIYEADLKSIVRQGANTLEIRTAGCVIAWEAKLWPPMLAGDFIVPDRAIPLIAKPIGEIAAGSWVEQGYPFFAGEGVYHRKVKLPPVAGDERLVLDLGEVAGASRVEVDGRQIGVRVALPWHFDLTPFAGKTIDLTCRVANTPHNLFMDKPMPAGLIGPTEIKRIKN